MTKTTKQAILFSFLLGGMATACGGEDDGANGARGGGNVDLAELREIKDCDACLAKGGTWQPEAHYCTPNCDIQDVSCFTDQCPGACTAEACGYCFSASECLASSCMWNQGAEALWCSCAAEGATPCERCLNQGGSWQPELSSCTSDCDIPHISCYSDQCPDA